VTLLMLSGESGPSTFDNGPIGYATGSEEVRHEEPPASTRPSSLYISESKEATHLVLRGRGTWSTTETFRRLAEDSLDSGRRLVVDLADCTHLDSAFLGTVHEIVGSHPAGRVSVRSPCASVITSWYASPGPARSFSLLANISLSVGERLEWDAQEERFTNSEQANHLLHYEYRKPWLLG